MNDPKPGQAGHGCDGLGYLEEADYHERFMESRLRVYVGREKLLQDLIDFASSDAEVPCLLTGPSGSGKSAALARFTMTYRVQRPDVLVIPHFVGASPGSTGLRQMLLRFCSILKSAFSFDDEIPADSNSLIDLFRQFLIQIPQDRKVLDSARVEKLGPSMQT